MSVRYRKHYSEADAEHYRRAKEVDHRSHWAEVGLVERALWRVAPGASILDLPCGAGKTSLAGAQIGSDLAMTIERNRKRSLSYVEDCAIEEGSKMALR